MFSGLAELRRLTLVSTKTFSSGKVTADYRAA